MDSRGEKTWTKRKRLHKLFKKHKEREYKATEFKDFTNAEKELFFEMLGIYNKEAEETYKMEAMMLHEVPSKTTIAINKRCMREILLLKCNRILEKEGCLEEVLNWDKN